MSHPSEWSREFLDRQEVVIRNSTVYVVDCNGYQKSIWSDSGIVDAQWIGGAVVITFQNGHRARVYGPDSGRQREDWFC